MKGFATWRGGCSPGVTLPQYASVIAAWKTKKNHAEHSPATLCERENKDQSAHVSSSIGVMDNINNVTLSDNTIALYSYAGIRAGAIRSGVNANTDLAGQCTLTNTIPHVCNVTFN
jgi:hypothetical protein